MHVLRWMYHRNFMEAVLQNRKPQPIVSRLGNVSEGCWQVGPLSYHNDYRFSQLPASLSLVYKQFTKWSPGLQMFTKQSARPP